MAVLGVGGVCGAEERVGFGQSLMGAAPPPLGRTDGGEGKE